MSQTRTLNTPDSHTGDSQVALGTNSVSPGSSAAPGADHSVTDTLHRLLSAERTRAKVSASSRKRALEHGCEILAGCDNLDARAVLDALLARERLGSTALGEGVAIPHCRLSDCKTPVGVLLTLEEPVDYNAPDDDPYKGQVDLLFILVVPESAADEHLQILAQLASILIDAGNREALRRARDHLTLLETMMSLERLPAANSSDPGKSDPETADPEIG